MKFYSLTRIHKDPESDKFTDIKNNSEYLFKDLNEARKFIQEDSENGCYGLCECLYNYIVLEERTFADDHTLGDWSWQEWYEMPLGQEEYKWTKIDIPPFAEGVVNWYS